MFKDFLKYPYSSKGLSYYIGFLMFVAVFFRGYTGSFILLVGTIITVSLAFFLHYKRGHKEGKPKTLKKPKEPIIVDNSALLKQKAFQQLVAHITFILKSKYPNVTWHFLCPNPQEYVITGGWTRLSTQNTGDFNCAEIFLSQDSNIKIQMLKVSEFGTLPDETYVYCENCNDLTHENNIETLDGCSYCLDCFNEIKAEKDEEIENKHLNVHTT